jgi:uncharacterized protein with PQ loop repeat
LLWVAYGFLIHSLPIILPNAVTFFLAFPLLVMKLRFSGAASAEDPEAGEAG